MYQQQASPLIAFYADEASSCSGIDATGPVEGDHRARALNALRRFIR